MAQGGKKVTAAAKQYITALFFFLFHWRMVIFFSCFVLQVVVKILRDEATPEVLKLSKFQTFLEIVEIFQIFFFFASLSRTISRRPFCGRFDLGYFVHCALMLQDVDRFKREHDVLSLVSHENIGKPSQNQIKSGWKFTRLQDPQ